MSAFEGPTYAQAARERRRARAAEARRRTRRRVMTAVLAWGSLLVVAALVLKAIADYV